MKYSKAEMDMLRAGWQDLGKVLPDIRVRLIYASPNNFCASVLYQDIRHAFLRPEAVQMMSKAAAYLSDIRPDLRFVILDAGRPLAVQALMFDRVKGSHQEAFVASPSKGSMHNYGMAVDLSLEDRLGNELDMGCSFDTFELIAMPRYEYFLQQSGRLSRLAIENRSLLRSCMEKAGFRPILSEWWHFEAADKDQVRRQFPIVA